MVKMAALKALLYDILKKLTVQVLKEYLNSVGKKGKKHDPVDAINGTGTLNNCDILDCIYVRQMYFVVFAFCCCVCSQIVACYSRWQRDK